MAHDFIVPPVDAFKDSTFLNLPIYETNQLERKSFFLKGLFQYLSVNPHNGFETEIPASIKNFIRQTPLHPALGMGYAKTKIGDIVAWPKPEIEIGNYFKVWKHPTPPVYEEAIRNMFYLQSGVQLHKFQFYDKYINANVVAKLVGYIPQMTKAAIVNTLKDIHGIFWVNFGMENPVVTDPDILQRFLAKNPESEALKNYLRYRPALGATQDKATAEQNDPLKDFAPYSAYKAANKEIEHPPHKAGMASYLKIVQNEAKEAIKNITYYDPDYEALWMTKADTEIALTKIEKPTDVGTLKKLVKKVYLKQQNKKPNTRAQTLACLIKLIRRAILELTDATTPSRRNWIKYNPVTGKGEPKYKYTFYNKEGRLETIYNYRLQKAKADGTGYEEEAADISYPCYARSDDLIVCVSTWDYNDLMDGSYVSGQAGVEVNKFSLPDGVQIIPMRFFRPGQVYIGDKHVLNYFILLDDIATVDHPTYLEHSWITNFIMSFGCFQFLAGKMFLPAKNYNAGSAFYTWALNEAKGLDG